MTSLSLLAITKEFDTIGNIIKTYCKGTGLNASVDKSKGMWLWGSGMAEPTNLVTSSGVNKLKIPGTIFRNDVTPNDNWGPRVNKIRSTLDK